MKDISLRDLLEAGCYFGHKAEKWHPKAEEFIFQKREGIHIIDLAKTKEMLEKAAEKVKSLGKKGQVLLFLATKRQAKSVVSKSAIRAGLPYMTTRWIGGFITNWEEVKKNIEKLGKMREDNSKGKWEKFPKHEQVNLAKELNKLEFIYGGVDSLTKVPDAIFVVDIKKEHTAVREANRRGVTSLAIVDTNSDPNKVDYPIAANDDAVRSIKYIVAYIANAYIEGRNIGEKKTEEGKETGKASQKVGDKEEKTFLESKEEPKKQKKSK